MDDLAKKMDLAQRYSDAIIEAQRVFKANPTYENAQRIQRMKKQRDALMRLMPKMRSVS